MEKEDARRATRRNLSRAASMSGESFVLVQHQGGGIMRQSLFHAVVEVIRRKADILDAAKNPIRPMMMVVCSRSMVSQTFAVCKVGIPIRIIDPGIESTAVVHLGGTEARPLVDRGNCRPMRPCVDTDERCGTCCNNQSKKKNKPR